MAVQLNADRRTAIDQLLWPTWRQQRTDPDSRIVSVMQRGIDNGLTESEVRNWLFVAGHNVALSDPAGASRSRHGADAVRALHGKGSAKAHYRTYEDLIEDDAIWESYWTTAMERVLRSTSLPRRVALDEIAEVFLLRLLRPFKNEYSRAYANARLRHGLMFLGMRILTQPDVITRAGAHTPSKTKLSVDRVTATLGWSPNGVIRCYRDLASMNAITYEKGGSFTPAAYGFPSRNRSAKRGYELSLKDRLFLARHEGTIAALIDGLPDPVTDIIPVLVTSRGGNVGPSHRLLRRLQRSAARRCSRGRGAGCSRIARGQ